MTDALLLLHDLGSRGSSDAQRRPMCGGVDGRHGVHPMRRTCFCPSREEEEENKEGLAGGLNCPFFLSFGLGLQDEGRSLDST